MSEFRPKRISRNELDEMIQDCINGVIRIDADETEIKFWLTVIPEALRYLYRKRKKIVRKLEEIENDLEEIDAKFKLVYIHSSQAEGNITERKDFATSMKLVKSPQYKELCNQHAMYTELLAGIDADITNVQEKSTSIRKFVNIETNKMQYDEDY